MKKYHGKKLGMTTAIPQKNPNPGVFKKYRDCTPEEKQAVDAYVDGSEFEKFKGRRWFSFNGGVGVYGGCIIF
jgi:hypothetical protein